jgi:signal transduction histidine kinase/ActR/RegA family two-component response regulator
MDLAPPSSRKSIWRSPNHVLVLACAVGVLILAACTALLYYVSAAVDGIAEASETQLMERSTERRLARLKDDVASVSVWSDAYDYTARRFDPEWSHTNYGVYFHQYLRHDTSVILDAYDKPLQAWIDGEIVDLASAAPFVDVTAPLVRAARLQAARKIAAKPSSLGFDRVGDAQAAVRVGNEIYMVGASTIVPEPQYEKALLASPDPVVISAVKVDAEYLKELDADYRLSRAHLHLGGVVHMPASLLRRIDGTPVASISWSPDRPGVGVYRDAKWPILVVAVVVLATAILLILRLRALAKDLVVALDRAEAGQRAKSEFIANMSHEIRTPLNGVLGMAQAMAAHELCPEQRARLEIVRDSGATLLAVLNDVLDFAKIEAGKLELEAAPFHPVDLAQRVCDTFAEVAAAKDLGLHLAVEGDASRLRMGDAMRIRQVLSNLVSNAIKFTAAGSVTLTVHAERDHLRYSVADTGIGLAPEQIPLLFDKFSQADASTTRRFGGTGLGLSICQGMADLMGGTIGVTSRLGHGATFTFRLPAPEAAPEHSPAVEPRTAPVDEAHGLRILAAEDNPTNQLVLRALIDPLGADLTVVGNGREAVEAYRSQSFDVILLDIQMPEMNGLDAARAIREVEHLSGEPRTPIVALTANVMNHQVEAYLAAGMDGHVAKPIDAAALYDALETALVATALRKTAA